MDTRAPTTILGSDAIIRGEVTLVSPARIDGRVEGRIDSSAHVLVGGSAQCACDVTAESVSVEGCVDGDVVARGLLELKVGSRVTGSISAASISIEEGASFCGQCRIGTPATAPPAAAPTSGEAARPTARAVPTPATAVPAPVIATRPIRAPAPVGVPMSAEERRQHELLRDPEMARLLQQ